MQPSRKPPGYWEQFIPALTDFGNRAKGGLMAVGRALKPEGLTGSDLASRGAAAYLGSPVDLITMALRPMGYSTPDEQVVGGSEWLGQQMENLGLVGEGRAPIQEALVSMVSPSAAAKNTAMAVPALAGIFVGKSSKTWDAAAEALAQKLEAQGADAREIWRQTRGMSDTRLTGTWRGPVDGGWRQELDDSGALFNTAIRNGRKVENDLMAFPVSLGPTVGGILEHSALEKAYPNLVENTVIKMGDGSVRGQYDPNTNTITLYGPASVEDARSTTLHELMHPIQKLEGFAEGGNPNQFQLKPITDKRALGLSEDLSKQLYNGLSVHEFLTHPWRAPEDVQLLLSKAGAKKELNAIVKHYGFDSVEDAVKFLQHENQRRTPFGQYWGLPGEAEARAVQERMKMSLRDRRETFPLDSYDVPLYELTRTDKP